MRVVWLVGLCLAVTMVAAEVSFEQVALNGRMSVRTALEAATRQTGVRFVGLNQLPRGNDQPYDLTGPVPRLLSRITEATGVLFTRLGVYDWLAVPPQQIAPPPNPSAVLGDLTVVVAGISYALRPGSHLRAELDEPRRLVLDLRVEADADLAAARVYGFDLETLQYIDDSGARHEVMRDQYRAPDWQRRRLGHRCAVPFDPPPEIATTITTFRGDVLTYEQVEPHDFEFEVGEQRQTSADGPVSVQYQGREQVGGLWSVELQVTRAAGLGGEEPWTGAALHAGDGSLVRPKEMTFAPLPSDEEGMVATLQRLTFELPEGVEPGKLWYRVVDRRRPWGRQPFVIGNLPLPEPRVLVRPE
jgi:hypothetical protein